MGAEDVPPAPDPPTLQDTSGFHLRLLLADDNSVQHRHLPPLLRLEPGESRGVIQPELRRHPPDLVPPHVLSPRRQKCRAAVEEFHVAVLVLWHLVESFPAVRAKEEEARVGSRRGGGLPGAYVRTDHAAA